MPAPRPVITNEALARVRVAAAQQNADRSWLKARHLMEHEAVDGMHISYVSRLVTELVTRGEAEFWNPEGNSRSFRYTGLDKGRSFREVNRERWIELEHVHRDQGGQRFSLRERLTNERIKANSSGGSR